MQNIEESFKINDWENSELNELFWVKDGENQILDPIISTKLLSIASNFYLDSGIDLEIKDIQFTGSLVNFNYTENSDIDVHIIVDFESAPNPEVLKALADSKRWIWNKQHDIFIRGFEVELYVQDQNEQHSATGLYSILNNEWVKFPTLENPRTDPKDVSKKAETIKFEIESLEKEFDSTTEPELLYILMDKVGELRSKIVKMRRDSLSQTGDVFSVENLVFKELRNTGYLERLIELSNTTYDRMLSESKLLIDFDKLPKEGDLIYKSGKFYGNITCLQLDGKVCIDTINGSDLLPHQKFELYNKAGFVKIWTLK